MQGPLESPRLWEKHADKILRKTCLTPMIHEPCLYSSTFNGNCVLFMHQVDDFAMVAPNAKTSNMLMDLIDEKISIPIKRQGYLDMYNGVSTFIKLATISTLISKHSSTKFSNATLQHGLKHPTPRQTVPHHSHCNPNGSRNSTQQPLILTRRFKQHWLSRCNSHTVPASANYSGQ
jgi:hypothetical protein